MSSAPLPEPALPYRPLQLPCTLADFEAIQDDEDDPASIYYHTTVHLLCARHHLDLIPVQEDAEGIQVAYRGFTRIYDGMLAVDEVQRFTTIDVHGRPYVAVMTPFEP